MVQEDGNFAHDDGGGKDAKKNSFSWVWIKAFFSYKAAELHRAGFVITHRYPSASPESSSLPLRDWGWSALISIQSSKALYRNAFVLGLKMLSRASVIGIKREP